MWLLLIIAIPGVRPALRDLPRAAQGPGDEEVTVEFLFVLKSLWNYTYYIYIYILWYV